MSMHPGLTTPNQRQGAIMSKDATSGEVRTLSPTPYKGAQVNALISLWAPGGLAMLRDGQTTMSVGCINRDAGAALG